MELGNFSVSLAVKDLAVSRAFYEKFGFQVVGGDEAQNWLVLKSGFARIGIFQGMFEKNMLTFNPRWNSDAQEMPGPDVREIQRQLKDAGVTLDPEVDESKPGPGYFMAVDPDGNPILVDQHV